MLFDLEIHLRIFSSFGAVEAGSLLLNYGALYRKELMELQLWLSFAAQSAGLHIFPTCDNWVAMLVDHPGPQNHLTSPIFDLALEKLQNAQLVWFLPSPRGNLVVQVPPLGSRGHSCNRH